MKNPATQPPQYKDIGNVGYIASVFNFEEVNEAFFDAMMDEDCTFRAYVGL